MNWTHLGIITIVTAALSCIGFYKFVYFLSVGYGLAILGGGITILCLSMREGLCDTVTMLQCLLFVLYGLRLSGFLIIREFKNLAYRKTLKEASGKEPPVFVKAFIWIFCACLYTSQVSPMLFRATSTGSREVTLVSIGMAISLTGLVIEAVSDRQKSAQKKTNPDMVATKGLFRIVRCPNYFGEITFWTGVFISGIRTYSTVGMWITAVVAYIAIVYIMFNGAQRLEKRQDKRYGDRKEYQDYVRKTRIIIPLIPLYSLKPRKEAK